MGRHDEPGPESSRSDQAKRSGAPHDEPQQLALMERLVELSTQRTQMSAERTYMNAERTLSVWLRTALAAMVVGIAVDRFRLFVLEDTAAHVRTDRPSEWVGAALVGLGVLMAVAVAIRFRVYSVAYSGTYQVPRYHGPFVALAFSVIITVFGIILLVLLLTQS